MYIEVETVSSINYSSDGQVGSFDCFVGATKTNLS